jgi:acetyl-CoA C-acetyltransferase
MASRGIRDRVAIVSVSCTPFGELWDQSADDLIIDAAHRAIAPTGLSFDEIDAFWFGTMGSGVSGLPLARALRLKDKPVTRVENMCATGSEALRNACYAVASGAYDVAMALGVEKLKDSRWSGLVPQRPPADGTLSEATPPARFSYIAPAYRAKYGVSPEELREVLSRIAAKNHANGAKNELAQFRKPVSVETISRAPVVAGDLGVFDCSGVADGAAAAIVTTPELASRFVADPLYVKALSFVAGSADGNVDPSYDFTTFPEVVAAAEEAYRQAGVVNPREELAMAEVHDCFTPTELVLMEDLGFSDRGMAWKDVMDGAFELDGRLPVNPDGGLKAFGHPVGASGLRMLYECWLQLRGEAPPSRRISSSGDRPSLGLTHNLGGYPGECVTFVGIFGTDPS